MLLNLMGPLRRQLLHWMRPLAETPAWDEGWGAQQRLQFAQHYARMHTHTKVLTAGPFVLGRVVSPSTNCR